MESTDNYSEETPITQAVRAQYEAFPYPPLPITTQYNDLYTYCSYIFAQYARTHKLHLPEHKRALVAGCGTGSEIHLVAHMNPGIESIIGVDISRTSIDLAQERIQYHQLQHCQAQVGDILQPDTLPDGPFDFICSYGVIHHTADPVQALRHLADRLAPEGVMALMLYNKVGRSFLYQVRKALTLLTVDQLPVTEGIKFAQGLLEFAEPGSSLFGYARIHDRYYSFTENIVDNFFHAQDIAFSIGDIPDLLSKANLTFIDVAPLDRYWDPADLMSDLNQDFYDRYQSLSRLEQLQILELLNPSMQTQNVFWCCHADAFHPRSPFNLDRFRQGSWQVNPLFLDYGYLRDSQITFGELSKGSNRANELIKSGQQQVKWPLFKNKRKHSVMSREQLLRLLLPIARTPQTGEWLLSSWDPTLQDHVLNLFKQWEEDRIVLQVS